MMTLHCSPLQVLTGATENITNATVLDLSVLPAMPLAPPQPPVVPPDFEDTVTTDMIPEEVVVPPPLAVSPASPSEEEIVFVLPSSMRVTMEPSPQVGDESNLAIHTYSVLYDIAMITFPDWSSRARQCHHI